MSSPRSLLLVDDEPAVLITYQMILEQQGYEVTAVGSATAAMEALERRAFDLVLCDLTLHSERGGLEVIYAARHKNPGVAALLITGYAAPPETEEASGHSIMLLFKPVEVAELLTTIRDLLGPDATDMRQRA